VLLGDAGQLECPRLERVRLGRGGEAGAGAGQFDGVPHDERELAKKAAEAVAGLAGGGALSRGLALGRG